MDNLKKKIKIIIDRARMFFEFYHDYKDYKRWNYNNSKVKSLSAMESKILRQTHIIEKGLSLSTPRRGFGGPKIEELFTMLDEYLSLGYPTDNVPFQNALAVLSAYIEFQNTLDYKNDKINNKLCIYEKYKDVNFVSGIDFIKLIDLKKSIHNEYPIFFSSRHSVRQFSEQEVLPNEIEKAVKIAQKAPTACNRQACKVYYYSSKETNKKIGDLIAGNTGFADEVNKYLVITSDISAFYDTFERNQIYIEAGLFTMALIEALHYCGIASCALQNGEFYKKNLKFKEICGNIPQNEKIMIFLAIGHYKDEFSFAVSTRKNVSSILKIE